LAINFGDAMTQYYKSVSFPRALNANDESKIIRLAFNANDEFFGKYIHRLNSSQIRALLDFRTYEEIDKIAAQSSRSLNNTCIYLLKEKIKSNNINTGGTLYNFLKTKSFNISKKSATFINNKDKNFYNWYPYIEGFSFDFVEEILRAIIKRPKNVYDPFAGTGTTILVSATNNIPSAFSEINPFMRYLIETKIDTLLKYKKVIKHKYSIINNFLSDLINNSKSRRINNKYKYNYLIEKGYFQEDILFNLLFIKEQIYRLDKPVYIKNILKIALSSILVQESNMIRRSDLRYKRPKEYKEVKDDVVELFCNKVNAMFNDIEDYKDNLIAPTECLSENALEIKRPKDKYDLIVTSPPYANGTNYFRNTKLELLFLDFIKNEGELKELRTLAITSGINNVSRRNKKPEQLYYVKPIVRKLENDIYDSRIPRMIEAYFSDMKRIFNNIHRILSYNGDFFIDIGDSKYKNVHVPSDKIFEDIAGEVGFELIDKMKIRNRFSKDGSLLGQFLLHFKKRTSYSRKRVKTETETESGKIIKLTSKNQNAAELVRRNWEDFRDMLPYKNNPYAKRNWGSGLHSLCSYQGKIKPAIAHFLIEYFTKEDMTVLDPLCGVGTIPLEARLLKRKAYANDLSMIAYMNTFAKMGFFKRDECISIMDKLESYIKNNIPIPEDIKSYDFGFNKKLFDYYHHDTFKEIIAARNFFQNNGINTSTTAVIFSSLLHILHGNRPYALSRRSHPITPFAPQGDYIYKNLINKLWEKIDRVSKEFLKINEPEGFAFLGDYKEIINKMKHQSVDSIITSPPFFDSTKFYMSNWIRMWFSGWNKKDFSTQKQHYLETKQIKTISVYDEFFKICHILLKRNGSLVLHLGFSKKANMAELLIPYARKYFKIIGYFNEIVEDNENFGIRDQGSVKRHQYLFLTS